MELSKLKNLPDLINEADLITSKYNNSVSDLLEKCEEMDWKKLEVSALDKTDEILNNAINKGKEIEKQIKEKRMPITRLFDETKKMFTDKEKQAKNIVDQLTEFRNAINSEKLHRIQLEEAKRQEELQKREAEIAAKKIERENVIKEYMEYVKEMEARMNDKFYSLKQDEVSPFVLSLMDVEFNPNIHPKDEKLHNEAIYHLSNVRTSIIDKAPARIEELKKIENDEALAKEIEERIEKEKAEAAVEAEKRKNEALKQQEAETMSETMDAVFESAVKPTIELSKGTSVKKKYKVETHQAMLTIIQFWVQNEMNKMTMDDLNKKLSFMRTAADRSLNKTGEELKASGLKVIEDIRSRRYSKKSA